MKPLIWRPTMHAYFYQIQTRMKFCSASYSDFVVWRGVIRAENWIYPNEQFMATALEKVTSFIKSGVLPEILGRWYFKAPVSSASGSGSRALHQTEDISPQPYSCPCKSVVPRQAGRRRRDDCMWSWTVFDLVSGSLGAWQVTLNFQGQQTWNQSR